MNILESEIEDIVWNAFTKEAAVLEERGFPYSENYTYVRQFDLGGYGRADIIGFKTERSSCTMFNRETDIQIIELKRHKVNCDTLLQVVRYARGIKHLFRHEKINHSVSFSFHLIGRNVNRDLLHLIGHVRRLYLYEYSLSLSDGLRFKLLTSDNTSCAVFREDTQRLFSILKTNIKSRYQARDIFNSESFEDFPG